MRAIFLGGHADGRREIFHNPPPESLKLPTPTPTDSFAAAVHLLWPELQFAVYTLAATGTAGAVYVLHSQDREMAEDFANDPDLWE